MKSERNFIRGFDTKVAQKRALDIGREYCAKVPSGRLSDCHIT